MIISKTQKLNTGVLIKPIKESLNKKLFKKVKTINFSDFLKVLILRNKINKYFYFSLNFRVLLELIYQKGKIIYQIAFILSKSFY